MGANSARIGHNSAYKLESSFLPRVDNFLGQVNDRFNFIEELKMKSVGMTEPKRMATFVSYDIIATLTWHSYENLFCTGLS